MDKAIFYTDPRSTKWKQADKLRKTACFASTNDVKNELRERRKSIIGSYASLCDYVYRDYKISDEVIAELCHFLTKRASYFWKDNLPMKEDFCNRFFQVSIYGLAHGRLRNESFDDIIQLSECLVRSRDVFITVVRDILPDDMISDMFYLTENYDREYYNPYFEDAVMGAVAVFFGTVSDPFECEVSSHE